MSSSTVPTKSSLTLTSPVRLLLNLISPRSASIEELVYEVTSEPDESSVTVVPVAFGSVGELLLASLYELTVGI